MSPSSSRTLAEELELQATRVELGLVDAIEPVPVGDEQRFLVREVLGQGGMGTIYLAHDQRLGRDVALKMVLFRLEHDRLEHRLQREARALAALRHENVLQVYDLAKTAAGELFIAMEYVPGKNFRQWQAQQERSLDEILDVYLQAGRGLAAAHERGIVHRDLKPDNVLVDESRARPRALVGDFGLAGEGPEAEDDTPTLEGGSASHQTHGLVGTLVYMAPEQLLREPADARSDQHQFCVALWEAIAGERPFPNEGRNLYPRAPLPPRPARMPGFVHRVLVRGLAFERRDRFVDMGQLLDALERGRRWRRAKPWLAGAASVAVVVLGVARVLVPDPCAHAGDRMAEIWTEDVRKEIDTSFRGIPADLADDVAGYLVNGLDQAAAQWTSRSQEVCEARTLAAGSDPALERRHTCLERWADRMERRVELLRTVGPEHATRAHELVAPMLELGDECRLPAAVIDARVQAKIEESEDAELLGLHGDALALAGKAVELAQEHGQACQADPVEADMVFSHELAAAYYREGYALRASSASVQALDALARAHLHAVACNDEQRDVDAQVHTAKIMAVDLEDVAGAERVLEEARARAGGMAEDALGLRRPELWKAAGLISTHRGDYDQARAHYDKGLTALGEPSEHPILAAKLISNIGVTYQDEERFEDAAQAYDRAFELVKGALGPEHPETRNRAARRALNLGLLAIERREHVVARQRLVEAVEAGHPALVVSALTAWAQSEHTAGSIERAEQVARELLPLLDEHPGLPRRVEATARSTAGQVLVERRDPRGVVLLSQALDAFVVEGDHDTMQTARYLLARGLRDLGRHAESRARLEEIRRAPVPSQLTQALVDLEHSLAPSPSHDNGVTP